MNRKILLVDIDHTLAASHWRDIYKPNDEEKAGDWDEYHAYSKDDKTIDEIVDVIRALSSTGWYPIGITARPGKWRDQTIDWLIQNDIFIVEVLMRGDDDFRNSVDIKKDLFLERFPDRTDHTFLLLDDHPGVIAAFATMNVTSLQVVASHSYHGR